MKSILKLLLKLALALLALALLLVVGAYLLVTRSSLPASVAASVFNDAQETHWLELDEARLGGDLLSVRSAGFRLVDRESSDPVVSVDRAEVALGGFPSDDYVAIRRVVVEGVRVDVTADELHKVEGLRSVREELAPPPEDGAPKAPPTVRLDEVVVRDMQVSVAAPDGALALKLDELTTHGQIGAKVILDLRVALPELSWRAATGGPSVALAELTLALHVSGDMARQQQDVTLRELALARLELPEVALEGLALPELTVKRDGLSADVTIRGLTIEALSLMGRDLGAVTLDLRGSGGLTGLDVSELRLKSALLSVEGKASGKLALGLSGSKLPYRFEARVSLAPAQLWPARCPGVTGAEGTFIVVGEAKSDQAWLEAVALTVSRGDQVTSLERDRVALPAGAARLEATLDLLCSTPPAEVPASTAAGE
jgi:hypothetical protein